MVDGKCGQCTKRQRKLTTTQAGYDGRWKKMSERLRAQHPLCQDCLANDRVTPSEHCHHIVPISVDPSRRLDPSNIAVLCRACHEARHKKEGK
jgi:5-methylcytosine-specific restriction protein A